MASEGRKSWFLIGRWLGNLHHADLLHFDSPSFCQIDVQKAASILIADKLNLQRGWISLERQGRSGPDVVSGLLLAPTVTKRPFFGTLWMKTKACAIQRDGSLNTCLMLCST